MASASVLKTLKLGPTNCYLLKCLDGYLLIDTSFPACFRPFLKELKKAKVDPAEIKYLLLTHSHDDHAGFAAELKEKTGCRVIVHKNSINTLKNGRITGLGRFLNRRAQIMMSLYRWTKRRNFEFSPVTLDDKDRIVDGDNEYLLKTIGIDGRIVYTPGHTNNSISVILACGDAFVGDVCMTFLGFLHGRPIVQDDLDLVYESWRKIIKIGARTIYPAHGRPFALEELIHYEKVYAS
jgi:glyoxylase-like metal-dependent hydrolase (beta-lactamase superfamily II)